jgi:hypothetical protein
VKARCYWAAVPLMLLLSAWIVGCSSGSSSSGPTSVPATPAAATTTAAGGDAVPEYKPSTVTSSEHVGGAGKTVLTSPDSAEKVTAFYENALQSGGWQVEKTTKSGDTVEYKAIKGTAAVEIEIRSAGAGASITVKVIQ